MRHRIVRGLSLLAMALAAAWFSVDPSFEPVITAILGLAGLLSSVGQRHGQRPDGSGETQALSAHPNSLAVLPLRSLGSDPEGDFFSEGITEDIISHLARIRDLRVISRTSSMRFKNSDASLRDIAAQLGVRNILEGSVRRSGDSLRVSAQLIDATTDHHLWAETYDRPWSDLFAVQGEIAASIAEALPATLSPAERSALATAPTRDLEAYRLVLEGRRHYDRADIPGSVAYYREATEHDPQYADAFAGLAEAWFYESAGYWDVRPRDTYPQVRMALKRALELDPHHADALAISGFTTYWYDLDWHAAEGLLQDALALGHSSAVPHMWYAVMNLMGGRFDDAVAGMARAVQYDPLSMTLHGNEAGILHLARRFDQAVAKYEWIAKFDPSGFVKSMIGLPLIQLGREEEALEALAEGARTAGDWIFFQQLLAYGLAAAGEEQECLSVLARLEEREKTEYVWPLGFAFAHVALGDPERAIARIIQSFEDRAGLIWLRAPVFDRLRGDPRYEEILTQTSPDGSPASRHTGKER